MALGDIRVLNAGAFGQIGAKKCQVAAGAVASIKAGEPVVRALGAAVVTAAADASPVVGTHFMEGIATTTSTDTVAAAGIVYVQDCLPGVIYCGKPEVAASWDTQAEYDALVGDRVLFDLTSGSYTISATDGATNGLVVENLDVLKNPGLVAFSVRQAARVLA